MSRANQVDQCLAGKAGANARRRNNARNALAHHHLLGMAFGEFVHVGAGNQLVPLTLERGHRELDHVLARQQVVEELQLHRMQHVFAVVQHHAGELDPRLALVVEDPLDQEVEAVGLRGRPRMRHFHPPDLSVALFHALDFLDRLRIVDVRADEHHVVLVVENLHHVLDHGGNHVMFLPRRNHDRQRLLPALEQLLGRQLRVVAPLEREVPEDPAAPVPQVDEQVIERRDEDDDGDDGRKDLQAGVVVGDEQVPGHGTPLSTSVTVPRSRSCGAAPGWHRPAMR